MTVSQYPPPERLQSLNKRKHRYTKSSSSSQEYAADGSSKRQKLQHPTIPPPAFWDGLSTVPLCASALRELNRRNRCQLLAKEDRPVSPESSRRSRRLRAGRAITDNARLFADQFLERCSANSLKGVKRLAKHGGPDLTELRGCRAPRATDKEMSSSQSSLGRRKRGSQSPEKRDSSNTTTTRSTGPYDRAFQQHLIDHRIFPNRYKYHDGQAPPRPENLDEIKDVLLRSRQSLSPSQFPKERFESFQQADEQATKESDVMPDVIPIIEGHVKDKKCVASDVLFANLSPLTNGELVPGKPDRCHGARPEQLDRNIRRELGGHIIPSTQHDLPIVPTFFLEAKGPDGSLSVATRQACYVGALGARGIRTLQSYGDPEPVYDNKAYTLTSIYHGGQLKMYASHPIRPSSPGGTPGYVMTQIDTWSLTGNSEAFRKGTAAYRNGIDWSKQKRDEAIERANKMARGVDDLGLSFASEVSAENTDPSQDTITHHESNRTPLICDSDTSADPADLIPIGKRHKAIELAVEDAGAQSDPREEAASRGSPLKPPCTQSRHGRR